MQNIKENTINIFENIKHINENGHEYWEARELQKILEYTEWRKFSSVIRKAMVVCSNSYNNVEYDFVGVDKIVSAGATFKKIKDYHLSRYACYLIAQNADSRKQVISLAQTYFAVKTRERELYEKEYFNLSEDERRLQERRKVKNKNYSLNQVAKNAGVKNFDKFHNAGYKGLYNGETADDIFQRKKLRYREDILDNMGSEELVDNLFRIIHTESKLKREKIDNEYEATATHYKVGREVRNFIKKLGGTMPEELPTPKKSIKELGNSSDIDKV